MGFASLDPSYDYCTEISNFRRRSAEFGIHRVQSVHYMANMSIYVHETERTGRAMLAVLLATALVANSGCRNKLNEDLSDRTIDPQISNCLLSNGINSEFNFTHWYLKK